MRTSVQERAEREYERYRAYTRYQLEKDEIAAAAEFLESHSIFHLEFQRADDDFFDVDPDGKKTSLMKTTLLAREHYAEIARIAPEFYWQAARAELETQHIEHALTMQPNEMRLVLSDCPEDELRNYGKNVFGYQLERGLGFAQLFFIDKSRNLHIYGHSFDRNDRDGLARIYEAFNYSFDSTSWSLAQPIDMAIEIDNPKQIVEHVMKIYDTTLSEKYGGQWLAGRSKHEIQEEAITFVRRQTDLLDAHIERMIHVGPKSEQANDQRYDFLLAMRNRFNNKLISSDSAAGEMISAGNDGRSNGESVSFCGITIEVPQNATLSERLDAIGMHMNRKWHKGSCRICLDIFNPLRIVGECSICEHCEGADNRGEDLAHIHNAAKKKLAQRAMLPHVAGNISRRAELPTPNKIDMIRQQFGRHAAMRTELTIGGADHLVVDRVTNEVITKL